MGDWADSFRGLRRFAGDNTQIEFRQSGRVMRSMQLCMKLVRSGNRQALAIQRLSVFRAPHKSPHLRDFGQVRGVKASD
jgi:hypothetical protein